MSSIIPINPCLLLLCENDPVTRPPIANQPWTIRGVLEMAILNVSYFQDARESTHRSRYLRMTWNFLKTVACPAKDIAGVARVLNAKVVLLQKAGCPKWIALFHVHFVANLYSMTQWLLFVWVLKTFWPSSGTCATIPEGPTSVCHVQSFPWSMKIKTFTKGGTVHSFKTSVLRRPSFVSNTYLSLHLFFFVDSMRPILGFSEETYHNFPAKCVDFLALGIGVRFSCFRGIRTLVTEIQNGNVPSAPREVIEILGWRPPKIWWFGKLSCLCLCLFFGNGEVEVSFWIFVWAWSLRLV